MLRPLNALPILALCLFMVTCLSCEEITDNKNVIQDELSQLLLDLELATASQNINALEKV